LGRTHCVRTICLFIISPRNDGTELVTPFYSPDTSFKHSIGNILSVIQEKDKTRRIVDNIYECLKINLIEYPQEERNQKKSPRDEFKEGLKKYSKDYLRENLKQEIKGELEERLKDIPQEKIEHKIETSIKSAIKSVEEKDDLRKKTGEKTRGKRRNRTREIIRN